MSRTLSRVLAPFAAFSLAIYLLYPSFRLQINAALQPFASESIYATLVAGGVAYALAAFAAGSVVRFLGVQITRLLAALPGRLGAKFSYGHMYREIAPLVEKLFRTYFPSDYDLPTSGLLSVVDKLDSVRNFLRKHDPSGFDVIVQQFAKVDVARAASVYSFAIILLEVVHSGARPVVLAVASAALVVSLLAIPRRMQKVVRAQYAFLVTAAALREESAHEGATDIGKESGIMEQTHLTVRGVK